jgi:hypothetical protein
MNQYARKYTVSQTNNAEAESDNHWKLFSTSAKSLPASKFVNYREKHIRDTYWEIRSKAYLQECWGAPWALLECKYRVCCYVWYAGEGNKFGEFDVAWGWRVDMRWTAWIQPLASTCTCAVVGVEGTIRPIRDLLWLSDLDWGVAVEGKGIETELEVSVIARKCKSRRWVKGGRQIGSGMVSLKDVPFDVCYSSDLWHVLDTQSES